MTLELAAASFVALFQELTLIRWLPGQIRVLAYFPNLVLLSAFLGLGLGCLRAGRRSLLLAWPALLLAVVVSSVVMSGVAFTGRAASEHLFLLYYDLPPGAPVVNNVELPLILIFILSALSFVPLGQVVAERLDTFRAQGRPLSGYCWDIAGSFCGVLAFALVSFAGAFPAVWFSILLGIGLLFADGKAWRRLAFVGLAACAPLLVLRAERAHTYSPYYALSTSRQEGYSGFSVLTNGSLHQHAFGLRRDDPGLSADQQSTRLGYHTPYRSLGRPPRRALVVGAGTGNDVAVLLDEGAEHVDAVEIDPAILDLGRYHPDRPYDSPRVRTFNTDARSFLKASSEKYDVIVFGTLDSMTRLSALSNVRLDNFVYTTDCLRVAKERLTADGALVMYYMVATDYIDARLVGMLALAFDELPLVVAHDYAVFNRILMVGPGFQQHAAPRRASAPEFLRHLERRGLELPSDDWPFLYLSGRGISGFYLMLMAVFAGLAVLGVAAASREMRQAVGGRGGVDWEMFLFGLGFLLLETRSVTQMNLAWGGTWLTNAVVFGSILAVVLLATLVTQRYRTGFAPALFALVLALLGAYGLPAGSLTGASLAGKLALSALFVGAPVFCASLCFAALFRDRARAATAFGWNLLGAVAGGLLEFSSTAIGLKALLLVALAAYLLAYWIRIRSTRALVAAVPQEAR